VPVKFRFHRKPTARVMSNTPSSRPVLPNPFQEEFHNSSKPPPTLPRNANPPHYPIVRSPLFSSARVQTRSRARSDARLVNTSFDAINPHAPRTSPVTRHHHPVPFSTESPVCLQSFALMANPQPELCPTPRLPPEPWPNPTDFLKVSHPNFSTAQPFSKGVSYLTQTPPNTSAQRQPATLTHYPTPSLQFCTISDTFTGAFRR